jgi:hypothetical protein
MTSSSMARSVQMLFQSASDPDSSTCSLNPSLSSSSSSSTPKSKTVKKPRRTWTSSAHRSPLLSANRQSPPCHITRQQSAPATSIPRNSPHRRVRIDSPTYAGAKFNESPAPCELPPPPVTWILGPPPASPPITHSHVSTPIRIHPRQLILAAAAAS